MSIGTPLVSTATSGTASPAAITAPAGRGVGNLLLVGYTQDSTTRSVTTPTGWTLVDGPITSTTQRGYTYARYADGTATDNFSAVLSGATNWICGMVAYPGVNNSGAVLTTAIIAHSTNLDASSVQPMTTPSLSTSVIGGCVLVGMYTVDAVSTLRTFSPTSTSPSVGTPVERYDKNEGTGFLAAAAYDTVGLTLAPSTAYTMTATCNGAEVGTHYAFMLARAIQTANGSIAITGNATGHENPHGTATGAIAITGDASGTAPVAGSGMSFVVGTPFVATASVTTGTPNLSSGYVAGDYTYLFCGVAASTGTITAPAGYSTLDAARHAGSNTSHTSAIFYRAWQAGDTDPAVTCASGRLIVIPVKVSGADGTTPVEVSAINADTVADAAVIASSVSPTNGRLLLTAHFGRSGTSGVGVTWGAAPSGMTLVSAASTSVAAVSEQAVALYKQTLGAGGATGAKTATPSQVLNWTSNSLVFVAAGAVIPSGTATGTIGVTGSATGHSVHRGTATGAIAITGSAVGHSTHRGTATGSVAVTGSAIGHSVHRSTVVGSISITGSATGTMPGVGAKHGTATGSIAVTGSATGHSVHRGQATGSIGATGSATGTAPTVGAKHGTATGTVAITGSATGHAPTVGAQSGAASGNVSITGTAAGHSVHGGVAAGAVSIGGAATGYAILGGSAQGSIAVIGYARGWTTIIVVIPIEQIAMVHADQNVSRVLAENRVIGAFD